MSKCLVSKSHEKEGYWRLVWKSGDKKRITCTVCECEWESKSLKYDSLPILTQEEIDTRLLGKYN